MKIKMKPITRRQFFKTVAGSVVSFAALLASAPRAFAEKFFHEPPWLTKSPYWGMAIAVDNCIGCGKCVEACKTENDVPRQPYFFRTWVERYMIHRSGETKVESPNGGMDGFPPIKKSGDMMRSFFVPKMCNHCENSPCEQVCPVGASFRTQDGVVLIDRKYCIGCRYCIQACPYGCRYFHPKLHVADKCTLCYHRITRGLKPACVEACPNGARIFGDLSNPESPVSKFIENNTVQVLKPAMGTRPKLVYRGLDREVR